MSETSDIFPAKEIQEKLSEFEMRVPVWGITVFTVDGYIIAHRLFYDGMPENVEMAVSAMSAGLITISEDFIKLVDSTKLFRQVLVDSEDAEGQEAFSIILRHVAENVLLTCIFPHSVQLGLVSFEIENLSRDIVEIVNRWEVKLHQDTMT
ncbi:MAG: roadblock/LC7 domain-containing protein, partial [Candidatus Thorarchaeota archaeon]